MPPRAVEDVTVEVTAADDRGDLAEAIRLLEVARLELHDPRLDALLVERYLDLPRDEAEERIREWWEQDHDRFSGAALARLLVDSDRKSEALTVLGESLGADAWPEYWRLLALLRDEQGDIVGAVTAMEMYVRLAPEAGETWIDLADMQQRAGENNRALLSLRHAADVMPDSILPRMLRLRILADEGRWREARDLAESLIGGEYQDASSDILYDLRDILARAYFVHGDFPAARTIWHSLLDERPHDTEVRYRLAHLELSAHCHRRALLALQQCPEAEQDLRVLDVRLRCHLALREWGEAETVARAIDAQDPIAPVMPVVRAAEAIAGKEYGWAADQLSGEPPERFRDIWINLRLDCLAHLGHWQDLLPTLKSLTQPDDAILSRAALICMAAGKLDVAERLLEEVEDQQSAETRSLNALLGPLRQWRRAAEVRRQQQIDEAERQRRAAESRDLRRRVRDLELHNAALADSLARSEAALERLLDLVGVSADGGVPPDWEEQLSHIADRAHKDALAQELERAGLALRSMVGERCWGRLSEHARLALREGEWLFAAVEGEDRDYGAALLEYARGLERAFKDAIFVPIRSQWERQPGPLGRLQDEGHDPSLGPFVRWVLHGGHLTLGSMAAALDRMADGRRQGVAIALLREQLGIQHYDERALEDWKRTADRLALAAEARNTPAHAGAVNREGVRQFRDLVLGTDGLLRALDMS